MALHPHEPFPPSEAARDLRARIDRRALLISTARIGMAGMISGAIGTRAARAEPSAKEGTQGAVPIVFPMLGGSWDYANLGERADAAWGGMPADVPSPCLEPEACGNWIKTIAESLGVDRVWGGYGERRKTLWKGYYEDAPVVIHLGLDFNGLPPGCPVAVPGAVRVANSWGDPSEHNGWGGRLIMEMAERWRGTRYLLYGHLDPRLLPHVGEAFLAGEVVGVIAPSRFNGGWDPHLHVQLVSDAMFEAYRGRLEDLDGYYLADDDGYRRLAPDPTELVVVR